MLVSEALRVFLEDYVWLRGYSKETERSYRNAVHNFISVNGNLEVQKITLEHLKAWKQDMEQSHHEKNGIIHYLYKMRLFLRWLKRKHGLEIDLDDFVIPKRVQKLPNYFDPEDVDKLIKKVAPDRFLYNEARNRAIIALLYSSGIRSGELRRIRLRDIRKNEIKIRGKGDKDRIVFVDTRATMYINDYLTTRPQKSEYLFVTFRNKPMDKTSIIKLLQKTALNAGFNQAITAHTYRHSFATHLLKNGCNLRHIQEMLGHADISTTQIYTHVAVGDLRDAYNRYH